MGQSSNTSFIRVALLLTALAGICRAQSETMLPPGIKAVWDVGRAWRQTTPTRERISINGLWRWQPASVGDQEPPVERWGWFKVPGAWPGITDYLQKDSQTVWAHPKWKGTRMSEVSEAWYQREIEVPAGWEGRRIALAVEYLNSFATVYVEGKKAGELRFPGGQIDLSSVCRAGKKYLLSLHVVAMPLKAVRLSYADTAAAKEVKGTVQRRGICGDVYLIGEPVASRISDVAVETSVRKGEVTVRAALEELSADRQYTLRAEIVKDGAHVIEFASKQFGKTDLMDGGLAFSTKWKPDELWDIDTPGNQFEMRVSLVDASGKVVDIYWPQRFGFREFWIDGRDFYLNGTRLFVCALPVDNAEIGAAWATYDAARETLLRFKRIGINLVYTHNYGCEPGTHLSFEEILRAADDVGMLVSFSQPHFSQYDWKAAGADENNGYARDAAFYVRAAENHPSVVFYSMSHNATGYEQDMDPDLIDGIHDPRPSANNVKLALRAEAIVRRLDPTRIVYHHAGGNIGSMHTINFYPNFAPIQELSDWFEHWATTGVKPLFLCEYGAPFTWDWTMYRGWYNGKREFGSAQVPWEFCLAEWNSQFLGDRAFDMQEQEKANLRWEEKQYRAGRVWHRWDYPTQVGSPVFAGRNEVLGMYTTDNWRAYRTWGVSGISPWEYEMFWTVRSGVDRGRKELAVDWENLQRPGFSADYIGQRFERIDTAFEFDDWEPTAAGKALLRNNQPVLAYIGGEAGAFTSKDHNYLARQTVEKQLIIINNSRRTLTFQCKWSLDIPKALGGQSEVSVETGRQVRIPLRFELPATLAPGSYQIRATVGFNGNEEQSDAFTVDVIPRPSPVKSGRAVALFDPQGETATLLKQLGVDFQRIKENETLTADETLVIGKHALTVEGPAPDLSRVRDGLKVVVFEQSSQAMEKRLGFRVVEYGLRRVFKRIPDHPLLAGIETDQLHDWNGQATTVPPRREYQIRSRYGPTVQWCGLPETQIWRCGNRGDVASVLIEKPARGDFRPIVDGGFSLQYAPLMEYREGKGMVLFCQLDVTGRSEADPTAKILCRNIFEYIGRWKAAPTRRAIYVGEPTGKSHLQAMGVESVAYEGGALPSQEVLILGPSASKQKQVPGREVIGNFLKGGGRVVAVGLNQDEADALLPVKVRMRVREHISTVFDPPDAESPFAGIGPADVEFREPRQIPVVSEGATTLGDGVLGFAPAGAAKPQIIFCQIAPWQFDYSHSYNLKRTFRHSSFLLARLLGNLGVRGGTPLLERFHHPVQSGPEEKRWLNGLYLDVPEEWDDPYRFFRW